MASIRCEELTFDLSVRPGGLYDRTGTQVVSRIGVNNTTTTLTSTSQIVFGPADSDMNVLIEVNGGDAYATKGVPVTSGNSPAATSANSKRVRAEEYVQMRLMAGEFIAAVSMTTL